MNFSDNLRAAREKYGYSQAELAGLVGVSQPTYAQWETGAKVPTILTAVKLARKLETTCEALVLGDKVVTDDA